MVLNISSDSSKFLILDIPFDREAKINDLMLIDLLLTEIIHIHLLED